MRELRSKKLIVFKGFLFLLMALLSAGLILHEFSSIRVGVLLLILVWASCRFYYFLFYVLERYVDPALRYAGVWALLVSVFRKGRDHVV